MVLGEGARLMKGFSQVKQTLPTVTGPPDKKLQENSKYRKKEFQTFAGHRIGWKSETVWLFKGKRVPSRHLYYVRMENEVQKS